jgi:hypothetical protein
MILTIAVSPILASLSIAALVSRDPVELQFLRRFALW